MIGRTLSHFRILVKIGEGGMGVVYRAEDTKLRRPVALKVLPPELVGNEERRLRFLREARAAAAVTHSNIATVHEVDEAEGVVFIAMELVEGKTLRDHIAGRPMPIKDALRITTEVAEGLAKAHQAGVIHRDFKPDNVIVDSDGHAKILDFGLAKLREERGDVTASEASRLETISEEITRAGKVLGTAAYMSPEQARGRPLDSRSDLFSFGTTLYEMVTGRRPFQGKTSTDILSAIIRDEPVPPSQQNAQVSPDLERIVLKCLEKEPEGRYQSAGDLWKHLAACQSKLAASGVGLRSLLRRPRFAIAGVVLLVVAAAIVTWLFVKNSRVRWAREEAIPRIEALWAQSADLAEGTKMWEAFDIATEAEVVLGDDPDLIRIWGEIASEISIGSEPPGADVWAKAYAAPQAEWRHLGRTPLAGLRFPLGASRVKVDLAGYRSAHDLLLTTWGRDELIFSLQPEGSIPKGMEFVPGGELGMYFSLPGLEHLEAEPTRDFLFDRYEVTNRDYKTFIDAGGYKERRYWNHSFSEGGRTLSWEEAISRFTDRTGRPGPATWEVGDYPDGDDHYPVGGVSWYEAAAYAEFAGKSLPTIFHWNQVAFTLASAEIIPLSNLGGRGLAPVGSHEGMHRYGVYDLAGNVREWTQNALTRDEQRYILGGGWNDPDYAFNNAFAQSPWDRSSTNGFRCMRYLNSEDESPGLTRTIDIPFRDFYKETPVSDEIFEAFRRQFQYDRTPLEVLPEEEESYDDWKRQKVTYTAAYGDERMAAYLFFPQRGTPPYQIVIVFPGSEVIDYSSSAGLTLPWWFAHLLTSGRAVIYPIYKSTFERGDELDSDYPDESNFWKEHVIMWGKDLARSIDYLETRDDINVDKLAFFGVSWGGWVGTMLPAIEPRIKVNVLYGAGLLFQRALPEVDQINYIPHVRMPTLMINGELDFFYPVETSQKRLYDLLGTPEEHKRYVVYPGSHLAPRVDLFRETLDWLDRYLGKVD